MIYICICIYMCMCMYVLCYDVLCVAWYVYTTLSSLALFSQPVCAWVGWHRCLTVCTHTHTYSINYSTALIIITIIIIIIHIIQYTYILQLYGYQIWYLFTLYCVMWRGYVIHQLLYILHYAILYVYVCPIPLWYIYMTMYYNLTYYINILYY